MAYLKSQWAAKLNHPEHFCVERLYPSWLNMSSSQRCHCLTTYAIDITLGVLLLSFNHDVWFQMILKFFDIFLKMKDLTSSEAFMVQSHPVLLYINVTTLPQWECTCQFCQKPNGKLPGKQWFIAIIFLCETQISKTIVDFV